MTQIVLLFFIFDLATACQWDGAIGKAEAQQLGNGNNGGSSEVWQLSSSVTAKTKCSQPCIYALSLMWPWRVRGTEQFTTEDRKFRGLGGLRSLAKTKEKFLLNFQTSKLLNFRLFNCSVNGMMYAFGSLPLRRMMSLR